MKRNRKTQIRAVALLFLAAVALNPGLFQKHERVDERITQNLPDRLFGVRSLLEGRLPLWNPCLFGGTPHIATHQSAFFYPPNILLFSIVPPIRALKISTALHSLLAGLFMFLYLRRLRIRPFGAAAGGLVFMMCGYLLSHESHTANRDSVVWIPLLFFFTEGFLKRRGRADFAGGALCFAVMVFSGYMHTTVIAGFMVGVYLLFRLLFSRGKFKLKGALGVGLMITAGAGLAAVQILATWGILDQTPRQEITYEVFSSGFFPLSYLPLIFFPLLFGGGYPHGIPCRYCGVHNLHELTGWIGILPLVLAGLGFFLARKGRRRPAALAWMTIAASSLFLCFGRDNPLYRITYYIPGYNLFKGPAKNWLGVHLGVAVLAGFGVHYLELGRRRLPALFRRVSRVALFSQLAVGMLMLLFIAALHLFSVRTWPNCTTDDFSRFYGWTNPAVWLPLAGVFLNAAVLFFFCLFKKRGILLLCLPVLIPQILFIRNNIHITHYSTDSIYRTPGKNPVFAFLKEREKDLHSFRIYPIRLRVGEGDERLLYPSVNSVYGIRSLSGYGPLFHRDYSALLSIQSIGIAYRLENLLKDNRVLSMMNLKYLLVHPRRSGYEPVLEILENAREAPPGNEPLYREVYRSPGGVRVYENLRALPRAWSISRLRTPPELKDRLNDAGQVIGWIYHWKNAFDPSREALLMDFDAGITAGPYEPGRVNVKREGPNRIRADVEAGGEAFIVFSETFFPGWRARIDGSPARLFRVNLIQMGMPVPPGRHTIEIFYRPGSFLAGAAVSIFFALFLLTLGLYRKTDGV